MSDATPLDYAARCERYARQRGWAYDPHQLSIGHLTPKQRHRALKKERHAWPGYSRRSIDMPWDPRYHAYNDDGLAAVVRAIADSPQVREELERRFLGDVTSWKPAGLARPSQPEEPS